MVTTPKRKRCRSSSSSRSVQPVYEVYEVEEVIGQKLVDGKLLFCVKWWKFNLAETSWEPVENLDRCVVFKDYINEKFLSLEKDIYLRICNIKLRLKKRIRAALRQQKAITMYEIHPFDPFEYKIAQVCDQLLPHDEKHEAFREDLVEMVFRNYFFKLDQVQRQQNDVLLAAIRQKEDLTVTIENDEDYDKPPIFTYITKNFLSDAIYFIKGSLSGCKCTVCSKDSDCCPKLMKKKFAYKRDSKGRIAMRFTGPDLIVECGELCKCGLSCFNRLTQQPKKFPLCLFKTKDQGWGVKAMTDIPKNSYIIEYVGELIGQKEADKRVRTEYLFDMTFHETAPESTKDSYDFYTLDSYNFGNLSRFINHSCEPNTQISHVTSCHGDPKDQKLCFFSNQNIAKGQEITLDYTGGAGPGENKTLICKCQSKNCRKYVY